MRLGGSHRRAGWLIGFGVVAVVGIAGLLWSWPVDSARSPEPALMVSSDDAIGLSGEKPNAIIASRFPQDWETSRPMSIAAFALANAHKPEVLANASALDWLTSPLVFDQARLSLASLPPYLTAKPGLPADAAVMIPPPRPVLKANLFTARQIASIKERLKLSPDQEEMWPAVEAALRAITWRGSADKLNHRSATLDPKSLLQITTVLGPFVKKLRAEQKDELRSIAHVMGLGRLASQL